MLSSATEETFPQDKNSILLMHNDNKHEPELRMRIASLNANKRIDGRKETTIIGGDVMVSKVELRVEIIMNMLQYIIDNPCSLICLSRTTIQIKCREFKLDVKRNIDNISPEKRREFMATIEILEIINEKNGNRSAFD